MEMVEDQIKARGVKNPAVLKAMQRVPRHEFVDENLKTEAYRDQPLPIGEGQTVSQPYIVAFMSEAAEVRPGDKVLEIGTGSGYQAAVLAEMGAKVFSVEIIEPLGRQASEVLKKLNYNTVRTIIGDGYQGWPEAQPFDAILLTAAPKKIPSPLLDQLAEGGRLIAPVGAFEQKLIRLRKIKGKIHEEYLLPVKFVPMTGKAEESSG